MEDATIDYRLEKIEETLAELKNVIIENKLQSKEITDLKENLKELIQGINSHDKRLRELEAAPNKQKADNWKTIVDFVLKGILTVLGVLLLTKLGIQI